MVDLTEKTTQESPRRSFLGKVAATGLAAAALGGTASAGGNNGNGGGNNGGGNNDGIDIEIVGVYFKLSGNEIEVEDNEANFDELADIDVDVKNIRVKNVDIIDNNTLIINVGGINVDVVDVKVSGVLNGNKVSSEDSFNIG